MSYEICKSISRARQNADGKWTATITSAVNNVRPLTYRKVDFIPVESKRKLIAVILRDIYCGEIHLTGKSPYRDFIDACCYGLVKSPAKDKISHYDKKRDKVWEIRSDHNYWHGQECKERMDEKATNIYRKIDILKEAAYDEWAKEFEEWTPDKTQYFLYIDGNAIISYRNTRGGSRWYYSRYEDDTSRCRKFSALEVAKIKTRLGERHKVEAVQTPGAYTGKIA